MKKYPLIGVSIVAVIVLIVASLSNVVGFQTVQSSNQNVIKDEVDQKELLFQTILDIANNKEIQQIILKSQISRVGFLNPDARYSVFNTPVLTKNQLKHMYVIGLLLSKIISKSKMLSMVEQYRVSNQGMQKEITAVIQKDATINGEITQLSNSKCDCENDNTTGWNFPIFCAILSVILLFLIFIIVKLPYSPFIMALYTILQLGIILCV
jgi:hypothetical protein